MNRILMILLACTIAACSEDEHIHGEWAQTLSGLVIDAKTGVPIEGAEVYYMGKLWMETDVDGSYGVGTFGALRDSVSFEAEGYHRRNLNIPDDIPPFVDTRSDVRMDVLLEPS